MRNPCNVSKASEIFAAGHARFAIPYPMGATLLVLFGCSAADEAASSNEDVGQTREAITFPGQVTGQPADSTPPTNSAQQEEAELNFSIVGNNVIEAVAYNDTTGFSGWVPGATLMGWSHAVATIGGSNPGVNAWVHKKISAPDGIAVLLGDPALASPPNNNNIVWFSNLAVPTTGPFPACVSPPWFQGAPPCTPPADNRFPAPAGGVSDPRPYLRDACIALSQNGGVDFTLLQCLTPDAGYLDGGSLGAGGPAGSSVAVAAYLNPNPQNFLASRSIFYVATPPFAIWSRQTGARDPFTGVGVTLGHPKVAVDATTGAVAVVTNALAPTPISLLYNIAPRFNNAALANPNDPTNDFVGPQFIDTGMPFQGVETVDIGSKQIGLGPSYDVAVRRNTNGSLEARIAYVKREPNGFLHLRGARCTTTCPAQGPCPTTCATVPGWHSRAINGGDGLAGSPHHEFHPRIAYANGQWVVAMYTTFNTSSGQLRVGAIRFNDDGTRTIGEFAPPGTPPGTLPPVITPCVNSAFGDYDDIKFNPTQGHFVTTHTDSGCPTAHIAQRIVSF